MMTDSVVVVQENPITVRVVIGQVLSGGGSSVWGGITGNLEDQTDLQEALDGKATSAQGALADSAVQPGDLSLYVQSNTTGITGADQITNMVSLTQAEYDAIDTPDASTLYVITG